jgi:predicted TIM-barrel fold metal-dependent hydrolase
MSFGTNQTSLLDFLKYFKGNARAFGIVDHETITLKELKELDKAGMKGVRINYPQYDAIGNLEKQIELIKKQAECIKQVGWSLQIQDNNPEFWEKVSHFTPPKPKPILGVLFDRVTDQVAWFINLQLVPVLKELTIPVITDHYAYLKGHTWFSHSDGSSFDPLTQPGLQSLISLLKSGKLYIKLSAPYRVSNDPHYADMKAVTRALVEANPKRILWGSDWPHNWRWEDQVGCDPFEVQPPLVVDSLGWLETLKNWLTEEEFRLMMVDNPRELFL